MLLLSIACIALSTVGAQDGTWILNNGGNFVEVIPGKVDTLYAAPRGSGAAATATQRVPKTPQTPHAWEFAFTIKAGRPGTIPTRFEIYGGSRFFSAAVAGDPPTLTLECGDKTLATVPVGEKRLIGLKGNATSMVVSLDGRPIGTVSGKIPDLITFGGRRGESGTQTEVWLTFDKGQVSYYEPEKPLPPVMRLKDLPLRITLKRITKGTSDVLGMKYAASYWCYVTFENLSDKTVYWDDAGLLEMYWEDYSRFVGNAYLFHPTGDPRDPYNYKSNPAIPSRKETELRPGESIEVLFCSGMSTIPVGKIVRANMKTKDDLWPLTVPNAG